ncbi:Pentapeptide repeat [Trinorchestia longiramus]|nr:Pentapeptide repeat [Trinorchestia longiramus]
MGERSLLKRLLHVVTFLTLAITFTISQLSNTESLVSSKSPRFESSNSYFQPHGVGTYSDTDQHFADGFLKHNPDRIARDLSNLSLRDSVPTKTLEHYSSKTRRLFPYPKTISDVYRPISTHPLHANAFHGLYGTLFQLDKSLPTLNNFHSSTEHWDKAKLSHKNFHDSHLHQRKIHLPANNSQESGTYRDTESSLNIRKGVLRSVTTKPSGIDPQPSHLMSSEHETFHSSGEGSNLSPSLQGVLSRVKHHHLEGSQNNSHQPSYTIELLPPPALASPFAQVTVEVQLLPWFLREDESGHGSCIDRAVAETESRAALKAHPPPAGVSITVHLPPAVSLSISPPILRHILCQTLLNILPAGIDHQYCYGAWLCLQCITNNKMSGFTLSQRAVGGASGASASGTDASGASASGTDASGASASGTDASGASASGTDASGASASGTDASGASTSGTDASDASTSGTDASGASASGAGVSSFKETVLCTEYIVYFASQHHFFIISSAPLQHILSTSSAPLFHHFLSTTPASPQHLLHTSSAPPQHLLSTSSAPPQHLLSTSSALPQHLFSTSSALPPHLFKPYIDHRTRLSGDGELIIDSTSACRK